jgi:hypothetical protein
LATDLQNVEDWMYQNVSWMRYFYGDRKRDLGKEIGRATKQRGKGIRVVIAIISDNAYDLPIATHGASTIV